MNERDTPDLPPGTSVNGAIVVVRFADGSAPTSATFVLVGHPALGTRQVDVFRLKRTVEDYQKETQQEREKSQRLGQELARMKFEHGPGGLAGMIASGLVMVDEQGVKAEDITKGIIKAPSNALVMARVLSFRSNTTRKEGPEDVVKVAVAVKLRNPGTQPWTLQGAALVSKGQEPKPMKVRWQPSPVPPGVEEPEVVVVEWEMTAWKARGPFTLKLWDESGMRLVTLSNVTFP